MKNIFFLLRVPATIAILFLTQNNYQAQIDPGGAAIQLNTITTAVPFLLINPDARVSAMGGAGCAIASDANALFWNPARLAMNEVDDLGISFSRFGWLRALVDDMSLLYVSRYVKISNKTALGSSFKHFSLGTIIFTDQVGTTIREFKPKEFALDFHLAHRLNDNLGFGISTRYIYSNLTGGVNVMGAESKPGISVAADVSMFYTKGPFNFGVNISNIGSKMSYTETASRDFIPANLRLGVAFKIPFNENNLITLTTDFNKLLVPTAPVYAQNSTEIVSGFSNDVGVATGIIQSFYDAPGIVTFNEDGTFQVDHGSVFREEMREINLGGGIEYVLFNSYAIRAGYFYEHFSKGNRKYITVGAGFRYKWGEVDAFRLISTTQHNPLANTTGVTVKVNLNWRKNQKAN